ncbi:MAG: hypothetical protein ACQEXJ_21450 [Myxococcota bacterium]
MRKVPAAMLVLVLLVGLGGACWEAPDGRRTQPLPSPSGKYVLTVPIERNPAYHDSRVWKVTIRTPAGEVLYRDESSEFVGHLDVYRAWDEDDRVWLYNSDDGSVWFWERDGERWEKRHGGFGADRTVIERR